MLVLLGLVAVFGYAIPKKQQEMPVRIHFANSGGSVIFTHLVHHREYKIACAVCHHDMADSQEVTACGSCHPVNVDAAYIRDHQKNFKDKNSCVQCHHLEFDTFTFDHRSHEEYVEGCSDCHHSKDIEPEPQACSNCHGDKEGTTPSLRDAGHERCQACHEELFAEGTGGCSSCHEEKTSKLPGEKLSACSQCHYEKAGKDGKAAKGSKDLLLTRTNAFHDQCMGCHKKEQKGPYKDDECSKCHVR